MIVHLQRVADLLTRFGGHDHAAGLTLPADRVDELARRLDEQARAALDARHLRPRLRIDAELPLTAPLEQVVDQLQALAPFGRGNPEPRFLARGVEVVDAFAIGRDRTHLRLRLADGAVRREAIGFSMASLQPALGSRVDVVYVPGWNTYRGETRLQLQLKALRPTGDVVGTAPSPRADLATAGGD